MRILVKGFVGGYVCLPLKHPGPEPSFCFVNTVDAVDMDENEDFLLVETVDVIEMNSFF